MHIAHLAATESIGGAAKAAQRLHRSLPELGVFSEMHVGLKTSDDPNVWGPPLSWWRRKRFGLFRRLDAWPCAWMKTANGSQVSPAWIGAGAPNWDRINRADIVQLHWIGGGFLRLENLARIHRPIVWRLADMWALAGGEHYTDGCERFASGYRKDNRPPGESGLDVNRRVWERKRRVYSSLDLTIVTPSRWLADCARRSVLLGDREIVVVPTGQDVDRFRPLEANEKSSAREEFGLPRDRVLVGFGAMNAADDPRKGFRHLQGALAGLARQEAGKDIEAVVFGGGKGVQGLGVPVHSLGNIEGSEKLARVYGACDLFVAPSREENLANTVIEAMACGIPVAAFDIGGMPDIVRHGENGWLARPFDETDLGAGIAALCRSEETRRQWGHAARRTVLEGFTLGKQAHGFLRVYQRVLERRGGQAAA